MVVSDTERRSVSGCPARSCPRHTRAVRPGSEGVYADRSRARARWGCSHGAAWYEGQKTNRAGGGCDTPRRGRQPVLVAGRVGTWARLPANHPGMRSSRTSGSHLRKARPPSCPHQGGRPARAHRAPPEPAHRGGLQLAPPSCPPRPFTPEPSSPHRPAEQEPFFHHLQENPGRHGPGQRPKRRRTARGRCGAVAVHGCPRRDRNAARRAR